MDQQPLSQKRRWTRPSRAEWIAHGLLSISVLFMACMVLRGLLTLAPQMLLPREGYLACALWTLYTFIVCCVINWLQTGDRHSRWKRNPKFMHGKLINPSMFPAICFVVFTVATPLFWLIVWWFDLELPFPINTRIMLALIALAFVATIVTGLLGLWIRRKLNLRFLANLRDRQICYECSYDLRGNPLATCPECGFDNQSLYDRA